MTIELTTALEDDFNIYATRHASNLHLKNSLSGISLTSSWLKLALDTANFHIKVLGGFTFDDANDRIYWDQSNVINKSLPATFIGDAGLEVTAGLGIGVTVTLGLFVDDVLILETPLNFGAIDKIQGYGANSILLNANDVDLLQSGSYYEVKAKAATGETPTISLDYLNVTIKRD